MSKSLENFIESLKLAESLISIDREKYSNPPRLLDQQAVQGLRGGAAVLMVAAFEYFVKELSEEYMSSLIGIPLIVDFSKLPDKMKVQSIYKTLERAMKGPLYQPPKKKIDRLADIEQACRLIVSSNVNPQAFSETGNNPNSQAVSEIFANMGVDNVFDKIKSKFERKWGSPIAQTFIQDKLNEIVRRRHVIAHTADALSITRTDLNNSYKFLKSLAIVLDKELSNHIKDLIKTSAIV